MDTKSFNFWIFGSLFLGLVTWFYWPSSKFIFEMYDDYVYPAAAKQLLCEGQMHWAGGKPGIVLLAAVMGAVTPYSALFLYLFFGLITIAVLYLLLKSLGISSSLSFLSVLLWVSSPYFFYYSKTHHLVCLAFYLSGIFLCWTGIQQKNMNKYRFGSFLLGWSLLTYYLLTTYMPFVYLFFLYAWLKRGVSFFKIIINSAVPFLLPVVCFDVAALAGYVVWGKKNWPATYSFYGACKWMSTARSPWNFEFPTWITLFWQNEWQLVLLFFVAVIFFLLKMMFQHEVVGNKEQSLFMLVLFLPFFFWLVQSWTGSFTASRALIGVYPLYYGLFGFIIQKMIPKRFCILVLILFLPFVGLRLYANQIKLGPELITGYAVTADYLQKSSVKLIVYAGQKILWEQLVQDKKIISLNIANDPLEQIHNETLWKALVTKLIGYLDQGLSINFVISHSSYDDVAQFEKKFSEQFVLIKEHVFKNPHIASSFWIAENGFFIDDKSQLKPLSVIMVFALLKK